jgi:hypothetical protein
MSEPPAKVPVLRLVLGWIFVGVPLIWGVTQTILKAAALFK